VISDNVSSITTTAAIQILTEITYPSSIPLATATTASSTIVNTLAAVAFPNTTSTFTGDVYLTAEATSTATTTAFNLTKIIKELADSGLINDQTSTSFLKASATVVVLVGVILGTLLLTCLWGVCRDCCRDNKRLQKEKSRKLAAAALRDIAMRHFLISAQTANRQPTPHLSQKSPQSSPTSSLTAPVQFKSIGRGRGMQPRQPPQRYPVYGRGQSFLQFASGSSGYSSSSSSSSSPMSKI
jgi:hypothetical protein